LEEVSIGNAESGFAQKVIKVTSHDLQRQFFLAQRRKDAKKNRRNAAALCAFAREIFLA